MSGRKRIQTILRVIKGEYALSNYMTEVIISNFKADGAVGGGIAFAIVGDHENRPTDMTNLVVYGADSSGIKSESCNDNE